MTSSIKLYPLKVSNTSITNPTDIELSNWFSFQGDADTIWDFYDCSVFCSYCFFLSLFNLPLDKQSVLLQNVQTHKEFKTTTEQRRAGFLLWTVLKMLSPACDGAAASRLSQAYRHMASFVVTRRAADNWFVAGNKMAKSSRFCVLYALATHPNATW